MRVKKNKEGKPWEQWQNKATRTTRKQ